MPKDALQPIPARGEGGRHTYLLQGACIFPPFPVSAAFRSLKRSLFLRLLTFCSSPRTCCKLSAIQHLCFLGLLPNILSQLAWRGTQQNCQTCCPGSVRRTFWQCMNTGTKEPTVERKKSTFDLGSRSVGNLRDFNKKEIRCTNYQKRSR